MVWPRVVIILSLIGGECAAAQEAIERGFGNPPPASWTPDARSRSAVTIIEFSEFDCFPCSRSSSVLQQLVRARPGEIEVLFKHTPTSEASRLASEAAVAAGAQGKFWEMHDLLFGNQRRFSLRDLEGYAAELHLDVAAFHRVMEKHASAPTVDRDLAEGRGLGVTTSPTFFINGRRLVGAQGSAAFDAVIDSVLAGVKREPRQAGGVRPEDIAIEHAPMRGSLAAAVTIVEFSDFECAYCQGEAGVVEDVLKAYPSRVRWFFKHYPLPIHKNAPLAHEAAIAAGEQGKFWEMHDLLFTEPQAITHDDLVERAKQLKLVMTRFEGDLNSRRFKSVVEADRQEGMKFGVDGTPFYFVNGRPVSGALSLAEFKKVVEEELKKLTR